MEVPARTWLHTPHSMLGGETPLDRMDTGAGMDAVTAILVQVESGMPT